MKNSEKVKKKRKKSEKSIKVIEKQYFWNPKSNLEKIVRKLT